MGNPADTKSRGGEHEKAGASQGQSASELISERIAELGDWRGKTLSRMRKLIKERTRTSSRSGSGSGHAGLVARRHHLHGRVLQERRQADLRQGRVAEGSGPPLQLEPRRKLRRAIDIHEGERIDDAAFKDLIRAAVALNLKGKGKPKPRRAPSTSRS